MFAVCFHLIVRSFFFARSAFCFAFSSFLSYLSDVWNLFAHIPWTGMKTRKTKNTQPLHILLYLTCWRECVSYYVKRNWFLVLFKRVKSHEMKLEKKVSVYASFFSFQFDSLVYLALLSFFFAVCVVSHERPWIQYLSHWKMHSPKYENNKNNFNPNARTHTQQLVSR